MATYADLLDDLVTIQSNQEQNGYGNETAFDLVMDGDTAGLRLWLRSNPEVSVNSRDVGSGRALLHQACADGHKEIVKFLLQDTDANLSLRTMLGGLTALHLAVTNNHRSIAFQLLSNGADALARDKFGCSPMHYVKSASVAKLLVQYGGRVLDCNAKRKNALDSVRSCEELEVDDVGGLDNQQDVTALRTALHKYLKEQAQIEYKEKLSRLRELKQQAKVQHANQKQRAKKSLRNFQ